MQKYTRFQDIPQFTQAGSWQADFPLEHVMGFINSEIDEMGLQLNPDFQRGHVWTDEQQIAWLEYFLKGGKTGNIIYFNNPSRQWSVKKGEYNDYVCVDGLQRITAIQKFLNNEIKVFGSFYKEYEDTTRISSHTIKININNLKTEKEVLQWYIDMNTGGKPHTSEEINKVKELLKSCE